METGSNVSRQKLLVIVTSADMNTLYGYAATAEHVNVDAMDMDCVASTVADLLPTVPLMLLTKIEPQ